MLETAIRLMQAGVTPSVSEVAEAAEVSRATAYRYFPSQAALVAGGGRRGARADPDLDVRRRRRRATRVADLLGVGLPRIDAFEATFKAALKLSLEQWAQRPRRNAGRGAAVHARPPHRPAAGTRWRRCAATLRRRQFDRLAQALSLVFGVEALIVLKDIWGLDGAADAIVAQWAAQALVRAALAEKGGATTAQTIRLAPHLVRPDCTTVTRLSIWREA